MHLPSTLAMVSRAGGTTARPAGGGVRLRKLRTKLITSDAGSRPPNVATALRWVRDAANEPNGELSEDVVKFGMGFLGMRITDTLPETITRHQQKFKPDPSGLPPNRRPLLMVPRAARQDWARPLAWGRQCPDWQSLSKS